jgi:hypothetical protein
MTVGIVMVPAVLLVLAMAFTIWAIVTRRGTTRIALGIVGGLVCLVLGLGTLVSFVVYKMDSKHFRPETYKGPMGEVRLPNVNEATVYAVRMDAVGEKATRYRGKNGRIKMPAGSYQVYSYWVGSNPLRMFYYGGFSPPAWITVKAGAVTHLKVGEPIVASVRVVQVGNSEMSIAPEARGCAGETCSLLGLTGFQILSKSGKVLMERKGAFEYG